MKNSNQGPSSVTIPTKTYLTCSGCKYLQISAGVRGRNKVSNNYNCTHEDAPKNIGVFNFNIGLHVEGDPLPPHFCPFNNQI